MGTSLVGVGTEFFADFGVYDVRMTVPGGWLLAATGRQRERTDNADGTTTHRYYQEDVHDFAWTTSPDFLEARERFERDYVAAVLQHHRGRMGDAAQALGIERTNLYRKIKQLNIRWTAD